MSASSSPSKSISGKLSYYIERNNVKEVEKILDTIVYSDEITASDFLNPLFDRAAFKGDVPMMQLLLDKGADFEACKEDALFRANWENRISAVRFLLEKGADPRPIIGYARAKLQYEIVNIIEAHLRSENNKN